MLKKDSLTELLLLVGKVALKQEGTIFYADSAVYNRKAKIVEAFKNVHINDHDSIRKAGFLLSGYTCLRRFYLSSARFQKHIAGEAFYSW